jgi:hypothetical protein
LHPSIKLSLCNFKVCEKLHPWLAIKAQNNLYWPILLNNFINFYLVTKSLFLIISLPFSSRIFSWNWLLKLHSLNKKFQFHKSYLKSIEYFVVDRGCSEILDGLHHWSIGKKILKVSIPHLHFPRTTYPTKLLKRSRNWITKKMYSKENKRIQ